LVMVSIIDWLSDLWKRFSCSNLLMIDFSVDFVVVKFSMNVRFLFNGEFSSLNV
jgi:hypothetical protein